MVQSGGEGRVATVTDRRWGRCSARLPGLDCGNWPSCLVLLGNLGQNFGEIGVKDPLSEEAGLLVWRAWLS